MTGIEDLAADPMFHGAFLGAFLPGRRRTRLRALARSPVPPIAYQLRDGLKSGLRAALGRGRTEA